MESKAKITERYLLFSMWTLLIKLFFLCEWPLSRLILLAPHSSCLHRFKTNLLQFQIPRKNNLIGGTRLNALVPKRGDSWLLEELGTGACYLRKTNIPGQPQNVSAAPKMSTLMRQGPGTVFPIFSCSMFDYKLL